MHHLEVAAVTVDAGITQHLSNDGQLVTSIGSVCA